MNIIKRRVHFYETDGMKVVHHANYFKWFEEARVEYLRAGGICLNELMKKGIVFLIVEVQARYLKSAKYDDVIIIKTYLKEINRIKLTFYYEVVKEETGEILTKASTKGTYTDINTGKIVRIPQEKIAKLISISKEDRE